MKRQIKPRVARRGIRELAVGAPGEVAAAATLSSMDPAPSLTATALSYDPYRKFKFLVV